MITIGTIKKFAASTVIAGSLSLALGGAAVAVASSANAEPSAATGTTSSPEEIGQHTDGPSEAIRQGDAKHASELRPDWDRHRGK